VDPRGRETDALGAAGSLARLTEATGTEFPALLAARRRTEERLLERRRALAALSIDPDAAIVLMGSWGRLEVTAGSDDDFMCLVDGAPRASDDVRPGIAETWEALGGTGRRPGKEDIFGVPAFSQDLRTIGLEDDGNLNLTRRLLLLLESRAAVGDDVAAKVKAEVLEAYLHELAKDYKPPRFLLNDVIRYWRTIAVDFEAKHRKRDGREWGLRNAKLRTSRPLLFASGLLPILECHRLPAIAIGPFLAEQFEATPTDRVSSCFLKQNRPDSGARAMAAYDSFISMLEDENARYELETLPYEDRNSSKPFQEAKRLGAEIHGSLLSLLFETQSLSALTREYAIF
jgi:hypothetical protein